jgi:hypothetical protein
MDALIDFRPTDAELQLICDMPEQVAIGYLRARRKANGGRSDEPLSDIFDKFFQAPEA